MSLAKTAVYGILILAAALLLDLIFLARVARAAEPCPHVWVVAQAPDRDYPAGPTMTQIAQGFDNMDQPDCKFEQTAGDGGFYVQAQLQGTRLNVIANFPPDVVCSTRMPCYMVIGVRNNSCNAHVPRVVYVDGAHQTTARVTRTNGTPGQVRPLPPDGCESEALVYGYIAAPRVPGEPRRFAATVELK